jgi:hypothetical protein
MRHPSRRAVLGAATTALVAGCLSSDTGTDESEPTPATSAAPTATTAATPAAVGTEQTVGGVPVTLSNLAVQDSVLLLHDDTMSLATRDGERYVLVSVAVSEAESAPPPTAFSLLVDGEAAETTEFRGSLDGYGPRYDPSYTGDEGYLPFVVPTDVDADTARLVVEHEGETTAWRVGASALNALSRPKAAFELRAVDLPSQVRPDEHVSVRVAAENVSDVVGVFRGVLNVANLSAAYVPYAFEVDADPGETVVWEKRFDDRPPEAAEAVGFQLYTVAGDREVRAPVAVGTAVGTATAIDDGNR